MLKVTATELILDDASFEVHQLRKDAILRQQCRNALRKLAMQMRECEHDQRMQFGEQVMKLSAHVLAVTRDECDDMHELVHQLKQLFPNPSAPACACYHLKATVLKMQRQDACRTALKAWDWVLANCAEYPHLFHHIASFLIAELQETGKEPDRLKQMKDVFWTRTQDLWRPYSFHWLQGFLLVLPHHANILKDWSLCQLFETHFRHVCQKYAPDHILHVQYSLFFAHICLNAKRKQMASEVLESLETIVLRAFGMYHRLFFHVLLLQKRLARLRNQPNQVDFLNCIIQRLFPLH